MRTTIMITFSSSVNIARPPEAVFEFLTNVHRVQQAEGSPVLALDMTTSGAPRLGSRYREVVQMLPFYKGEFISEITAFEPPRLLELAYTGPGMIGGDRYDITATQEGANLHHKKWVSFTGLLRIIEPFMRKPFFSNLEARLVAIKRKLEEEDN
jgi:uncharacterized protein YndB with AHSA1/START domain